MDKPPINQRAQWMTHIVDAPTGKIHAVESSTANCSYTGLGWTWCFLSFHMLPTATATLLFILEVPHSKENAVSPTTVATRQGAILIPKHAKTHDM